MKINRRNFLKSIGFLGAVVVMPQFSGAPDIPDATVTDNEIYHQLKWLRPLEDKQERLSTISCDGWKGKIIFCGVEFDVPSYSLDQVIQYSTFMRHNETSLSVTIFGRVNDLEKIKCLVGSIQLCISDLKGNPDYLIDGYGWMKGWNRTRMANEEIKTDVTFIIAEIRYNHV